MGSHVRPFVWVISETTKRISIMFVMELWIEVVEFQVVHICQILSKRYKKFKCIFIDSSY